MKCPVDRIAAFVDDLLRDRRPLRFKASSEEIQALHAAAELSSARPGADRPDGRFIENVYAHINVNVRRMFP
jgi:hypothetical protein